MIDYDKFAISDRVVQLLGISEVLPCARSIVRLRKQFGNQVRTWLLSLGKGDDPFGIVYQ